MEQAIDKAFLHTLETLDFNVRTRMNGRFGGARRARAFGSSAEFADYRDYQPGDDLRRVDWNVAGRLDKYYIRRYVDERRFQNRVYLDCSASMNGVSDRKRTAALRLAAAMAFLSVENMDYASLALVCGARCRELCDTLTGRDSFYAAIQLLEDVRFEGEADLSCAVRCDPQPGYDNGISFIISDFFSEDSWKSAVDYLISRRREVALIQLTDPQELDPFVTGLTELVDGEGGRVKLSADRTALLAYREAVRCYQDDLRRFCAVRGIPLLSVSSDEPLDLAILEKGFAVGLIR